MLSPLFLLLDAAAAFTAALKPWLSLAHRLLRQLLHAPARVQQDGGRWQQLVPPLLLQLDSLLCPFFIILFLLLLPPLLPGLLFCRRCRIAGEEVKLLPPPLSVALLKACQYPAVLPLLPLKAIWLGVDPHQLRRCQATSGFQFCRRHCCSCRV